MAKKKIHSIDSYYKIFKKKKKSRIPKLWKIISYKSYSHSHIHYIDSTYLWVSHNYKGSYIQLLNEMSWLLKLRFYVNLWKSQLNVIKNCNNFFSIKNIKDKIMNNNC